MKIADRTRIDVYNHNTFIPMQKSISVYDRCLVVSWMSSVASKMPFKDITFHLSISLLDVCLNGDMLKKRMDIVQSNFQILARYVMSFDL